jgi:hypothetical protein
MDTPSKVFVSGGPPPSRRFYVFSPEGTMDGHWEDDVDGLHELITRSLTQRRALWALVLATYRVELTQVLDHAAKVGFEPDDRALVIDVASRIAAVAREVELVAIRSDALSLRNYAETEPEGEVGERRILLAGIKLIDRILDTERARQNEERAGESARPN